MIRIESSLLESIGDYSGAYYQGVPFTGTTFEKDKHGRLVAETDYKNGLEDGVSVEWWSNGLKRTEGVNRFGLPVGTHRTWDSDGQLLEEVEYDESSDARSVKRWDEDGNLIYEKIYSRPAD